AASCRASRPNGRDPTPAAPRSGSTDRPGTPARASLQRRLRSSVRRSSFGHFRVIIYIQHVYYSLGLMSRPAKQQRSERTRRDLLDAAREVFTRRGFAEASMEEIAERAGVTRGPPDLTCTSRSASLPGAS